MQKIYRGRLRWLYMGKERRRARKYQRSRSEWHGDRGASSPSRSPPPSHLPLLLLLLQVHCPLPSSAAPTPVFPGIAVLGPFAAAVHSRTTFRAWVRAPKVPARRSCVFRARTWLGRVLRASGLLHLGPKSLFPGPSCHVFLFSSLNLLVRELRILSYG